MKQLLLIILLILFSLTISAQGQSPSSIKWYEINTKHSKIIFPEEITDNAQKAGNLIDYLYAYETNSLKTKPKKIPIILYNQSTVSNGFAGLRPRRSVWFSTPTQFATELGTDDWFYILGTHEFRHIVQYSKMNNHFTKFLSTIFGQTGLLMGEYSIPYWFFEGDAVCTETSLTKGGRGRIPQFEMPVRTILLSDIKVSYDVAKFGSYKTFYPNYYNFGYLMTSQARVMFGKEVFNKTLDKSSRISFWPYSFSIGLKKTTGLNEKKMYQAVMSRLDSVWTDELSKIEPSNYTLINKAVKKTFTRYSEVNYLDENRFVVKKSSLNSDIPSFYIIDKFGNEEKIEPTDADLIHVANNKIVFARKYPDPRWQVRDYSDIIVFDITSKKEKRLTTKQKLFAPGFSTDGKTIVAVEYNKNMQSSLVLLDSENGKEIKRIASPNNAFIRTPAFNEKGDLITFTLSNEVGSALYLYDLTNEAFIQLTEFTPENIGRPVFYKHFILYNSPYSGIGNIHAIDMDTKQKYQVTSAKFGAYNVKVSGNKAVYSDYSSTGYNIAEITLSENDWKKIKDIEPYQFTTVDILQQQEQGKNILHPDLVPDSIFLIKKYNKLKNSLNIHSWGFNTTYPSNFDLESLLNFKPEFGFNIYSANLLNTVYGSFGTSYNFNENTFGSNIDVLFKKYYPEFSLSGSWKQRSAVYIDETDEWDELSSTIEVSLPLNLSRGIYYKGMNVRTAYSMIQKTDKEYRYISESGNGTFSTLSYTGSIHAFRQQATRDINPKFGYFAYLTYKHTPFNSEIKGQQLSGLASVYLPGIFIHHSTNIKIGYEKQKEFVETATQNYYWFSSPQSFPRGYYFTGYDEIKSLSFNYSLPLIYPDLNIGPLVYIKRIRADLFYDYAGLQLLSNNDQIIEIGSAGLEVFFQTYLFRLAEPIEIGVRLSYIFNPINGEQNIVPEFLVLGIPF